MIKNLAEEALQKGGGRIPIPIVDIAQEYDLAIYEIEMSVLGNQTPSGILTQRENKWFIAINKNDVAVRKRFTIAHEIGHFLLHKNQRFIDDFRFGETFYRSHSEDNQLEKEANYFAANLLMPESYVKKKWEELHNVTEMAKSFDVSEVSMTFRLKNLGLIEA